jgi:hypothetical protein
MTRYLITWKTVNARLPENREDRVKQQLAHAELVREALKSNAIKDWGITPDGGKGYAIFEGSDEDGARIATMYVPFYEFEETPILNADEWIEVLKSA